MKLSGQKIFFDRMHFIDLVLLLNIVCSDSLFLYNSVLLVSVGSNLLI